MKHVTSEQLWALAEDPKAAPPELGTHVETCVSCTAGLADITAAQSLLRLVPQPPPMPTAMAQRVELKLADAIEAHQAQRWTSWWAAMSMPRLAFAAMAATLVVLGVWAVLGSARIDPTSPLAVGPGLSPVAPVTPPPVVMPGPREPKLTATVASAKRARVANATLTATQVVREGAALTTDPGGSLWVRLPDGTRAGLTGSSEVQLATLEAKTLTLDLAKGSVSMMVPHREDRVLTVRAGELEVKDLGTQFLVSRELGRIVVAVEEGSVEVNVPGKRRTVTAGHAVAYQQGELDELEPLPPSTLALRTPLQGVPAVLPRVAEPVAEAAPPEQVGQLTEVPEAADETPPPPEDPTAEWSTLPPSAVASSQLESSFNRPPEQVTEATPPTKPGLSLGAIERRVSELRRQIRSPFTQGGTLRQQRAKEIGRLADGGDCLGTLDAANEWLRYAHDPPEELPVRREVLFQKMRCLRRLGRVAEVEQVRRELDAIPPPRSP